jgi:polysaccharide export outer membrane protein
MFQVEDFENSESIKKQLEQAENNYTLKTSDRITVRIETNKGEAMVDPNFQMRKEMGMNNQAMQNQGVNQTQYILRADGIVDLPLIGEVSLAGKTIFQSDSILRELYQSYYVEPFVITRVANRRVFVFTEQTGLVVPLENENMNIIEVLAVSGGISNNAKAHNIRLVRGNLKNPYVQEIDLSTIAGMQAANLQVQNQDIIYVEPVRRVLLEASRDIAPIFSLITTALTLIILFGIQPS